MIVFTSGIDAEVPQERGPFDLTSITIADGKDQHMEEVEESSVPLAGMHKQDSVSPMGGACTA